MEVGDFWGDLGGGFFGFEAGVAKGGEGFDKFAAAGEVCFGKVEFGEGAEFVFEFDDDFLGAFFAETGDAGEEFNIGGGDGLGDFVG